jgi:hypothetical protein
MCIQKIPLDFLYESSSNAPNKNKISVFIHKIYMVQPMNKKKKGRAAF